MAYSRPGTYVDEVLLREQTPVNATVAVGAFVAPARRGPIVPQKFQSWTDVTKSFGNFTGVPANDVLLQAIYDHLNNGGRTVYACRPVGTGAVAASLTFRLPSADAGVTPGANALTFTADNPGTWGNELHVEVLPGSTTDRFSLNIRLVPLGAAITTQQIVERWSDLSLDPTDGRNAIGILSNAQTGSAWVDVATAAGYVYTAGDTLAASTVPGGSALAGGNDGAAISDTATMNAVYQLDEVAQPFVLNLPGQTTASIVTALADYADASRIRQDNSEPGRGDVFVVVDSRPGVDADAAISLASTYPKSDHIAVYYPNLVVPDPANAVPGSTKLVPPGPAVTGRYIATDAARGSFKAPAGIVDGALSGVIALDPAASLKNPVLDRLNDANVNAIKVIPNRGITIFGARTQKRDFITRYVSARRTLISARADLVQALAFVPFENNDQFLWAAMANAADKVLRELYVAGGLKGASPEQAYFVKCDADNNTLAAVQAGEVHIEVGLALQRPAEFVVLTIAQFDGGASVVEELAA